MGSAVKLAVTVITKSEGLLEPDDCPVLSVMETNQLLPRAFALPYFALAAAVALFRQFRSRQERLIPAPVRYTRLASDINGLRLRMDTKLTSSCQLD